MRRFKDYDEVAPDSHGATRMTPDTPEPPDAVHATPTTPDLRSEMMKGGAGPRRRAAANHGGVRVDVIFAIPFGVPAVGIFPGYHLRPVRAPRRGPPSARRRLGAARPGLRRRGPSRCPSGCGKLGRRQHRPRRPRTRTMPPWPRRERSSAPSAARSTVTASSESGWRWTCVRITSPWSLSGRRSNRSPAKACVTRGATTRRGPCRSSRTCPPAI